MLRANVTVSRKISRDYNSCGYSVTLDGEIPFPPNDSQAVLEKVNELFGLAQEALAVEIDRDQGDSAIARRDEDKPKSPANANATTTNNGHSTTNGRSAPLPINRPNYTNGNNGHSSPDAATPKQIQFLQTMAKRQKLNDGQLQNRISEVLGRSCSINQLSKKEAGLILDNLTGGSVRTGG